MRTSHTMTATLPKQKPTSRQDSSVVNLNCCFVFWTVLLLLGITSVNLLFSLASEGFARDLKQLREAQANAAAVLSEVKLPFPSASASGFDRIQLKAYERALIAPSTTSRKAFSLKSWERESDDVTDSDRQFLGEIYLQAKSVFEFGLGESTLIAAAVNVPRYAGIDADAARISTVREQAQMDHFRFLLADVGAIGGWDKVINKKQRKIAYNYQVSSLAAELQPFDVYMINGRYRVACACLSFLHAMKLGADRSQVQVGIHDSDQEGRGYGVISKIANVVKMSQKLYLYQLKETTTQNDVLQLWIDHFDAFK